VLPSFLPILCLQVGERICWPDTAVAAITALEKASHETLGSDFQKYNQKMRQLDFNLKVAICYHFTLTINAFLSLQSDLQKSSHWSSCGSHDIGV